MQKSPIRLQKSFELNGRNKNVDLKPRCFELVCLLALRTVFLSCEWQEKKLQAILLFPTYYAWAKGPKDP